MKAMIHTTRSAALLAGIMFAVPAAIAHHSGAGFLTDEVQEISGTIKEFQFTNPHTWIQVIVIDDEGVETEWSVEWGSPNSLARRGVRPSTFPTGAEVTMRVNPMANGSPAGGFVAARFPDGRTVGNWQE